MTDELESVVDEEYRLFMEYRESRSPEIEERLLQRFKKLVYSILKDFNISPADIEDVTQVGITGLLLAIRRFDPESKNRFSTFAWPTIRGEIQRYFRDKRWAMKVPRKLKETSHKVFAAQSLLAAKIGQEPTAKEIAEETGLKEEEVLEAMELGSAYSPKSFYDNLDEDEYGHYASSSNVAGSGTGEIDEKSIVLDSLFRHLKKAEAEVLKLRFIDGLSQKEVAEILETSQMCISRIQRTALAKLRAMTSEVDFEEL